MGAIADQDEADVELSGAESAVIDLDGDTVELDEDYSVEVGVGSILSGNVTESSEETEETEFENPDTSTVGMLPTPAKVDETCTTEGDTEVSVRSLDASGAEGTAYLSAAPDSSRRSRRFFTSREFITSLKITSVKDFEFFRNEEAEAGVDALVCEVDQDGNLTWQPLEFSEVAASYRVVLGFVDKNNHFLDKNTSIQKIEDNGSVFIPKEYLALKNGEQVYVALFQKKTRAMQNSGAVVISNTGSKMKMTFPSSLADYFAHKAP